MARSRSYSGTIKKLQWHDQEATMGPSKKKATGKGKVVKVGGQKTLPLSDQTTPAEAEATKTTAGTPDVKSAEDLEEDSGDEFSGPIYEKFHQSGLDKVHKIDNDGTVWMRRKQEAYKKKESVRLLFGINSSELEGDYTNFHFLQKREDHPPHDCELCKHRLPGKTESGQVRRPKSTYFCLACSRSYGRFMYYCNEPQSLYNEHMNCYFLTHITTDGSNSGALGQQMFDMSA